MLCVGWTKLYIQHFLFVSAWNLLIPQHIWLLRWDKPGNMCWYYRLKKVNEVHRKVWRSVMVSSQVKRKNLFGTHLYSNMGLCPNDFLMQNELVWSAWLMKTPFSFSITLLKYKKQYILHFSYILIDFLDVRKLRLLENKMKNKMKTTFQFVAFTLCICTTQCEFPHLNTSIQTFRNKEVWKYEMNKYRLCTLVLHHRCTK